MVLRNVFDRGRSALLGGGQVAQGPTQQNVQIAGTPSPFELVEGDFLSNKSPKCPAGLFTELGEITVPVQERWVIGFAGQATPHEQGYVAVILQSADASSEVDTAAEKSEKRSAADGLFVIAITDHAGLSTRWRWTRRTEGLRASAEAATTSKPYPDPDIAKRVALPYQGDVNGIAYENDKVKVYLNPDADIAADHLQKAYCAIRIPVTRYAGVA